MIKPGDEILMLVLKVFTREAAKEDLQKLKDWCYEQDKSGVFFSKLSDPERIGADLTLMYKIEQARRDVWERILASISPEHDGRPSTN